MSTRKGNRDGCKEWLEAAGTRANGEKKGSSDSMPSSPVEASEDVVYMYTTGDGIWMKRGYGTYE